MRKGKAPIGRTIEAFIHEPGTGLCITKTQIPQHGSEKKFACPKLFSAGVKSA
jgi:hypothetical protein